MSRIGAGRETSHKVRGRRRSAQLQGGGATQAKGGAEEWAWFNLKGAVWARSARGRGGGVRRPGMRGVSGGQVGEIGFIRLEGAVKEEAG